MIEDRIRILRRAAQISSSERNEKVWCVIAGNDRLVDDIAYNAITAKDRVQILFRESISISSKHSYKKFDCILLKGETLKISELNNKTREEGGASLQITSTSLNNQPNLLVVIGPEDYMKKFVGETNRHNVKIDILLEDHTTGFIKSEPKTSFRLPSFLSSTFTPILDTSEVILSALLISVTDEDDIEKVKSISQNNHLFGIDLKTTIQDKEKSKIEAKEENKEEDKKEKEDKKENDKSKEENSNEKDEKKEE